ncbi:hypothetical protein CMU93_00940 [Elizabethkingia anophelis]|nr:hypothetical protein [Elizabethkingia anophelis]
MGVDAIYDMIVKDGLYQNEVLYGRNYKLSDKLGISDETFYALSRLMAILYFGSLILVIVSIFFIRKITWKHKYFFPIILCMLSLFVWLVFPHYFL